MEDVTQNELCILCSEILDPPVRVVQERGIQSLVKASRQRKDMKHLQLLQLKSVNVHEKCAKTYTAERSIQTYLKSQNSDSSSVQSRCSSHNEFKFDTLCLFCKEDASDDFIKKQCTVRSSKRKPVTFVSSDQFKNNLLQVVKDRTDKPSRDVLSRIITVENLANVQARYHRVCAQTFYMSLSREPHHLYETIAVKAAKFIAEHISEHNEQYQFSIKDILQNFQEEEWPEPRLLKKHLYNIFDNEIIIHRSKYGPIISYRNMGQQLLTDHWYKQKEANSKLERERIVKTAAKIIVEDIRTKVYDSKSYPAPHCFLKNVELDIPETLNIFLYELIVKSKQNNAKWKKKAIALAHCLLSAVRPRCFLSSLQVGLAAMLDKKFGSKELLLILNTLGFCASYDESLLFQSSVLVQPQNFELNNAYLQFVFDNADHNVNTIDGRNTFHVMGGIETVTPGESVCSTNSIERLNKIPSAEYLGQFGKITVKNFDKPTSSGLSQVIVKNLQNIKTLSLDIKILPTDFLWLCGRTYNKLSFEGWNGFMEIITEQQAFETSRIIYLPFVNAPPSNYDTIYTVLLETNEKCKATNQRNVFVTFDQPLYYKAREILECCREKLPHVIVRLGGFHLLMSFMGSIGNIMNGSGLKELLCEIYAENSVDKILTGHVYSRAVRGHILAHAALASIIIEDLSLTTDEFQFLQNILTTLGADSVNEINNEMFSDILKKFNIHLDDLKKNGPTAQLWIQYFENVTLMKQFIEAERSGNWDLHLECIRKMMPFFHATGHYLYAKSSHLYLQDMYELKTNMNPVEYDKFVNKGYFTIRRSQKFWSGIWSDMTIQQMLMRLMKSQGGLTHGRGITDSVLSKWISTMIAVIDVTQAIQTFCDVSFGTSEQHVDARPSRISRDSQDLNKLSVYLANHEPFAIRNDIVSISTGVKGDESINCYKAFDIGTSLMNEMTGKTFAQLKFVRKNKIVPLSAAVSAIKSNNEIISVDPTLIFQRISLAVQGKEDLKNYFQYELAPYPLSMFDDAGMRKTQKSKLYDTFIPVAEIPVFKNCLYIIDGGYLLHKVVWHLNDSFEHIADRYSQYIIQKFSTNCIIVFDGYPDDITKSTKTVERLRRATRQVSREIIFTASTLVSVSEDKFLSNDKNKNRLIAMLREKFDVIGLKTMQAEEDADTLIINTAIQHSSPDRDVVIIGEDIDLLVILSQLNPENSIYYVKPGKQNIIDKVYTANSFKYAHIRDLVACVHAFTGCDTTSAFFKQGKLKLINILQKNSALANELRIFNRQGANCKELVEIGCKIITAMYGEKALNKTTLNDFRYKSFKKYCRSNTFKLAALPPCESTASQHIFRVYLQVQKWLGNTLNPMEWGWKIDKWNGIIPIYSSESLLPPDFMKLIKCSCTLQCGKRCNCKKHGLKCTEFCDNCKDKNCNNLEENSVSDINDIFEENDICDQNEVDVISRELQENFDLNISDDEDDENDEHLLYNEPPAKKYKL